MNTENIKKLIKILEESGLESLSYKENDVEISISKGSAAPVAALAESVPVAASPAVAKEDALTSPLVGIFYLRPSPDAEPFVKEGRAVQKGDTICIIEAMKVMNEIKAKKSGTVQKIMVGDGAMVEFGQPLFLIN